MMLRQPIDITTHRLADGTNLLEMLTKVGSMNQEGFLAIYSGEYVKDHIE